MRYLLSTHFDWKRKKLGKKKHRDTYSHLLRKNKLATTGNLFIQNAATVWKEQPLAIQEGRFVLRGQTQMEGSQNTADGQNLHHFEAMKNLCSVVFTWESGFRPCTGGPFLDEPKGSPTCASRNQPTPARPCGPSPGSRAPGTREGTHPRRARSKRRPPGLHRKTIEKGILRWLALVVTHLYSPFN